MGHIFWNEYYRLLDSGENVDVLAIGDSWFHYPRNNLITPLYSALDRPTVYVIGENGARADELATGSWRANFATMLAQFQSIRLVCISAGGNDFAGIGDLDNRILAPDCSGESTVDGCYRVGQPDGVFDAVEAAYRTLIDTVTADLPDATILVHNYDYAIPDGRTLPGMRSWLKLPMDNDRVPIAGTPLGGLRRDIVRDLIDQLTLRLSDLEAELNGPGRPRIDLIWSAGTLVDSEWANELHPKSAAFERLVAECWSGPARAALGLP
jgi:GDSL-like Lipase/Acylhydrolase family